MKRVLITGASGFVGANLARRLLADGHELHLLMRSGYQSWRLQSICEQVSIHVIDMLNLHELEAKVAEIKPQWIFHLAAHGAYSWQENFEEILDTNFHSTIHLVQACLKQGFESFVHAGSSSEYGFKDHAPSEMEAVTPNSHYAFAKSAATLYCQFVASRDQAPITTLRLYSAYGPFEDPRRLVPNLILHGLQGTYPPLVSPDTARDYVYVADVVEGFLAAARNPTMATGKIYNLGSGRQTTLREIVDTVRQIFEIENSPPWGAMPARQWDTSIWVADPSRMQLDLGWSARTSLKEGLQVSAAWFRDVANDFAGHYQLFK